MSKHLSVDDVIAEVQSRREKKRPESPEINRPQKTDTPEIPAPIPPEAPEMPAPPIAEAPQTLQEAPETEPAAQTPQERGPAEAAAPEVPEAPAPQADEAALADEETPEQEPAYEEAPDFEEVSDLEEAPAAQSEAPAEGELTYAPLGTPEHFIRNDAFPRLFKTEAAYYTAKYQPEEAPADDEKSIYEASLESAEFEIEEYDSPDKKQAVAVSIQKKQRECTLILAATGLCALAALVFVLAGHFGLPPQKYAFVYLGLVVLPALANLRGFIAGLRGLFTLRATHDSAVSLASCISVLQCLSVLLDPKSFENGSLYLYAPIVSCAWFLGAIGRVIALRRISKNYIFLTSSEQKYAVSLLEDNADCVKIAGNYIERQPLVAFQKRADFYDRFIENSVQSDPSRFIVQLGAPMGLLASLILFVTSFFLFKDAVAAFTAFTASACIFIPIAALLCVNLPVSDLSSLARKWGGMICGYPAVEQFARTNIVLVDAEDLFPRGSTQLVNVQTFPGGDPKRAILCAASLIKCFEGPLADIFDQALQKLELSATAIESPLYEETYGLSGYADGTQVLVGNRKMMAKYSVTVPPQEIERQYNEKQQQLLYIALGGTLCAMLILSYRGDQRRAAELSRMEKNGYLIVVRTNDVNITPRLICSRFGIDGRSVRILPEKLGPIYEQNVNTPAERADSLILTKGRMTTMFRLLTACSIQKSNITFALILQIIAVLLGFVFVAFIACYSGLEQLKTGALLLYELFWLAAVLLVPKLRRP